MTKFRCFHTGRYTHEIECMYCNKFNWNQPNALDKFNKWETICLKGCDNTK